MEKMKMHEAEMTEERAKEILNAIDNGEFLIRIKFVRDDSKAVKSTVNQISESA